jgi:hypothetical protein
MSLKTKILWFTLGIWSFVFILYSQPAPLLPYGVIPWNLTDNVATNTATITAQQMQGILTGTPTSAATYTLDSATNICALFPNLPTRKGFNFDFYIKNASASQDRTITIAGGSGDTVVGSTVIPSGSLKRLKVVYSTCTGVPAVSIVPTSSAGW